MPTWSVPMMSSSPGEGRGLPVRPPAYVVVPCLFRGTMRHACPRDRVPCAIACRVATHTHPCACFSSPLHDSVNFRGWGRFIVEAAVCMDRHTVSPPNVFHRLFFGVPPVIHKRVCGGGRASSAYFPQRTWLAFVSPFCRGLGLRLASAVPLRRLLTRVTPQMGPLFPSVFSPECDANLQYRGQSLPVRT